MRRAAAILLALSLGLSSAFLVACGDRNKLLPQSDASAINAKLDSVSSAVAARNCIAAQDAVNAAERQAQSLPSNVDSKLQATLQANLEHVASSARSACTQSTQTKSTVSTATTPTQTTQSETTQTQTTTTQTTDTNPPTTDTGSTTGTTDTGQSGGVGPGNGNGAQRSPQD
jgi:GTPase involved in cell partitioning and DNA repair